MTESRFTWATVTDTSPLRIRLDGASFPLPITPDVLVYVPALSVNDRVRVEITPAGRYVIFGRSGGFAAGGSGLTEADIVDLIEDPDSDLSAALLAEGGSIFNVVRFGATGDGSTDDRAAFQAACDAAAAFGGSIVYVPTPSVHYRISDKVDVPDKVHIKGSGDHSAKVWSSSATNGIFELGLGSGLSDLWIDSTVTRTAGVFIQMTGNTSFLRRCNIRHYWKAVQVGDHAAGEMAVFIRIEDCEFFTAVTTAFGGAIQLDNYAGAQIRDNLILGPPKPAQQPAFGIKLVNGDTAIISDCNITLHGRALDFHNTASHYVTATQVVNSYFDSAGQMISGGDVSSVEFRNAGPIIHTLFTGCWFGLSDAQQSVNTGLGTGSVDGLSFVGCQFNGSAENGLVIGGGASILKNVSVVGCRIQNHGGSGIAIIGAAVNVVITGNRSGDVFAEPNDKGIYIAPVALNEYTIVGNDLTGNTTAALEDNATGTPTRRVHSNLGAADVAFGSYTDLSDVPATFPPSAHSHPQSDITGLAAALALKADDSAVVKLSGAQTVAGVKTFSSAPLVPASSFAIDRITGLQAALDAKITAFADPNADRIVFWDDSAGAFAALGLGAPLSITGTSLNVDSATTSQAGAAEIGTDTEFDTGTDTTHRFATLAQTRQLGRMFRAADAAATATFKARAIEGDLCFQADTGDTWRKTGSSWKLWHRPKTTWTPTWSAGVTVGNGSFTGSEYWVNNGMFFGTFTFTFGSTSAVTGSATANLPLAREHAATINTYGKMTDSSTATTIPCQVVLPSSADTMIFRVTDHVPQYGSVVNTTSAIPFPATAGNATGDIYTASFQYPVNVTV